MTLQQTLLICASVGGLGSLAIWGYWFRLSPSQNRPETECEHGRELIWCPECNGGES